ncbi:NYN domain-containing protein [Nocardia sp. NPDC057668]|uniref:NYN domain-containing protein n=1 Tax=Nocardia sp. NPDC057668 TaxID=3346202 RepID=UPI003671191D
MRSTCSVYIDAGYLLASAATRVTGTSLRKGIHVEYAPLITSLIDTAEARSGLPLLRVHWYDSADKGVPDKQQERIGELAKVKLRLGRFGFNGEQKGVDIRIGLDLVAHARNGASDVFFLVSGDDDLTEAVEEAQVHGVQVIVLAVPAIDGKPHSVSKHLIRAADELASLDGAAVDSAVMKVERPPAPEPAAPVPAPPRPAAAVPGRPTARTPLDLATSAPGLHAPRVGSVPVYSSSTGSPPQVFPDFDFDTDYDATMDATIDEVVDRVVSALHESASTIERLALRRGRPSIPRDIDRALLLDASQALGIFDLDEGIRNRLRHQFWTQYDRR